MASALILRASGVLTLEHGYPVDDLARLQQQVGGYIEAIRLDGEMLARAEQLAGDKLGELGRVFLVVNEEGKLHGLPSNLLATLVYGLEAIVGDALVCELPLDW